MTAAAERLVRLANDYRGLAAHHRDQGNEPLAQRCELVELCLREVAKALADDDEEEAA